MSNINRKEFFGAMSAGLLSISGKLEAQWSVKPQMEATEAVKYVTENINPILTRALNEPNQIPGVKSRLLALFQDTKPGGRMIYAAMPGFNPKSQDMLAHIDYDPKQKKPVFMVFVPAISREITKMNWSNFSQKDIDTYIAIIFAHEKIHDEIDNIQNKYPIEQRVNRRDDSLTATEEAEAWGITILELIRPAIKKGVKLPQFMVNNSLQLQKLGDNYKDPRWIRAFLPKK